MKRVLTNLPNSPVKRTTMILLIIGSFFLVNSVTLSATNLNEAIADSLTNNFESGKQMIFISDSSTVIDDYLAYAALESPALRRAFYNWKATLEKVGYAGALADPKFSYGYFIQNVETRVGPQNQKFSLRQAFPWFGTLSARKDIASEASRAAYQKYQAEKLKLFYSVRVAYNELYYLGRDIALTHDNLELLKFWESVARTKYKVALSSHPDLIKAQVELGMLEDRLFTLQNKIEPASARLRALLNLSDTITIFVPQKIEIFESEIDSKTVLNNALKNNPNLNVTLSLIDKEQATVRLAGKSSMPNFTVGLDYIETGEALNPLLDESGKDPWVVGVGINLPIWFGKNNAKKDEARARLQVAKYNHADAKNKLEAIVNRISFEYSDALRKVALYRDGLIPKAEQALKASYTSYQTAKTDFLYLLDTQRQLLVFQLKYERAIADLAIRRAEIEMITGNGLKNN